MAGGDDRLSELSDDLLRRVLHFAPVKEAASTTALSRRWRAPLWLSSGAINLEMPVGTYDPFRCNPQAEDVASFLSRRSAFVSAAVAALDAAAAAAAADDDHVTRLTLRLKSDGAESVDAFVNRNGAEEGNLVHVLLSHRAARRVEEIRLRMVAEQWGSDEDYDGETFQNRLGFYTVTLDALPSQTLHVLELTNCSGLCQPESATVLLPRLSSLRLRHCAQHLGSLQRVIDAAPELAVVRLDYVLIDATNDAPSRTKHGRADRFRREDRAYRYRRGYRQYDYNNEYNYGYTNGYNNSYSQGYMQEEEDHDHYTDDDDDEDAPPQQPKESAPRGLRCPAATVLVLDGCKWQGKDHDDNSYGYNYNNEKRNAVIDMVFDAPRLRRFKYKGLIRPFSFSPLPLELEQVDLHFWRDKYDRDNDPNRDLVTFWQFARSFTSTKGMRLRVNNFEEIAVLSKAKQAELLPAFRRLECLEVQGVHRPKGKTAAVAIGNLLRCCPVLCALRINLTAQHHNISKDCRWADEFLERKFTSDFDKTTDRLDHCVFQQPTKISLEGDHDAVEYDEVCEISTLTGCHLFECLQNTLRRVDLQFRLEESNCLGVKLIKVFAENAMVLEEMHIDGGNGRLHQHMNPKIERWVANSLERRNAGATRFVVLPLKR